MRIIISPKERMRMSMRIIYQPLPRMRIWMRILKQCGLSADANTRYISIMVCWPILLAIDALKYWLIISPTVWSHSLHVIGLFRPTNDRPVICYKFYNESKLMSFDVVCSCRLYVYLTLASLYFQIKNHSFWQCVEHFLQPLNTCYIKSDSKSVKCCSE